MSTMTFLSHRTSNCPPEQIPLDCVRCDRPLFQSVCRTCEGKGQRADTDAACDDCAATGYHTFCGECGYNATRPEESPAWLDTEPLLVTSRLLDVAPTVAAEVVAIARQEFLEIYDFGQIDHAWRLFCQR